MYREISKTEDRKLGNGTRRGQGWSIDLLIFMMFVSILVLTFITVWNNIAIRWNADRMFDENWEYAITAADILLTNSGDPLEWQKANVTDQTIISIGLIGGRNEIDNEKLEKLRQITDSDYGFTKNKLGIKSRNFLLLIYFFIIIFRRILIILAITQIFH